MPAESKSERFHEIDLLRFLAAFAVLLFHYTWRGWSADNMSDVSFTGLGEFFKYGYLGVHLFFIISGFVILMTAMNKDLTGFTISRITRLFPAYWFAVSLTALVTLWIGGTRYQVDIKQYLINLTMLHRFVNVPSVDGVYWSLVVELKFYLLIFLIILINHIRYIQWYLFGWLAASLILFHFGHIPVIGFFLFPEWSSYFIAGAVFFLIRREGMDRYKFILLLGAYYLSMQTLYASLHGPPNNGHAVETDTYLIIAALVSLFYLIFIAIAFGKAHIINRPGFVLLGALTYPVYLIHQNIGFMLFNVFNTSANKYILLAAVTGLMLLGAWLIHTQIEKRFAPVLKRALIRVLPKS
ncbi:MAG: acyltransferase [Gammaproteobacteria bacterium]|nr:acyltransferase [Gammaproteobacteria bacterium]MDH5652352.1 acyltransferase [Gammaproteobacteria bacterium]